MGKLNRTVIRLLRGHRSVLLGAAIGVLSGCSTPSADNKTGQNGQTVGQCVVSGGSNSGAVTQNCEVPPPRMNSPYRARLQDMYYQGGLIARQWQAFPQNVTDKYIDDLSDKAADWANGTYNWIAKNITPAAAEKFALIVPSIGTYSVQGVKISQDSQQKIDNWTKRMPQYMQNLDALMRSDEMFPQ
jgi:hypothetical protein